MFDKTIANKPPTVDYKSIMEADGVAEWTRQIVRISKQRSAAVANLKERIRVVICQELSN